jgi:RND family efflux transporter MFP subunit
MRLAGVQTAVAEQGNIERTIRAAGVVRADERRIRHVHTKVAGWIEKLYADFTGEAVHKGRPILTIYSQELLASQQEYLRAREGAQKLQGSSVVGARQGADAMLAAARERLELFDVPPEFIAALDHTGAPQRTVTLLAPASGIVTAKQIVEGQQIEPGMELFSISDLSRVWIEADVYESEASAIHVGQDARLALPSDPGAPLTGKVKYIYPYLSPDTRTLKVRFDFANPGLKLKLDMFVNVDLTVQTDEGVIVPDSAIMDTGVRQIAFANPTNGRFEPRLVKVGIRADGKAQILDGIKPGERVATKANFLLDSESRLRAAISGAEAQPAASDGAP